MGRARGGRSMLAATATALVVGITGCGGGGLAPTVDASTPSRSASGSQSGHEREKFGPAWADIDRNGCDNRNDVLRRDLHRVTVKAGTRGCVVVSGVLADPCTGRTIRFVRGGASEVDIDHVVALSDAWRSGAQAWTSEKRRGLANDPLNLLAVDASANQRKGDADAATWLPQRRSFRCAYVARQVAVKAKYALSVACAEADAMRRVLAGCPDQPIPAATPESTTTAGPSSQGTDPRLGTCREVREKGLGPYREGEDPEYAWYRDGDGDGVVCDTRAATGRRTSTAPRRTAGRWGWRTARDRHRRGS